MTPPGRRAAGYAHLIDHFAIAAVPHHHESWVDQGAGRRTLAVGNRVETVYPLSYWPGDSLGDHLAFALKYDGINLSLLAQIFKAAPRAELIAWLSQTPTGKYTRKIWFLYEFLTGDRLPLEDLTVGNYLDLLNPKSYVTGPSRKLSRYKIRNNLLGNAWFCPIVRRTDKLKAAEAFSLRAACDALIADYPVHQLKRALSFLYHKETRSSFEIEDIAPDTQKIDKFIQLLLRAESEDFCTKPLLIHAQNSIVDPRFADTDYRTNQNYIGQNLPLTVGGQRIHFICPKPEHIHPLMDGLLEAHRLMQLGETAPIVHAAVIAYGFVFLHPFEDGNGRIHRFLVHNILHLRGAVPREMMFPISAAMLKHPQAYNASLEAFSYPLLDHIDYTMDSTQSMTVTHDTADFYRFMDLTTQAESLADFVALTLKEELAPELQYLAGYDRAKTRIQEIVDLPERLLDHFITNCYKNHGRLSNNKRKQLFACLTDEEIVALEAAFREAFATPDAPSR